MVGATVIGGRVTGARDGCSKPPLLKKSTYLHVYSYRQACTGRMHTHRNTCTRTLINAGNFVVKDTRAHTHAHTFFSSFHSFQRIYSDTSKKKSIY